MVDATLAGLEALAALPTPPEHVCLLSGADYPIRPLQQLEAFLGRHRGIDFIEHVDALEERWVRDGPQRARFRFWHGFNWRHHPHLHALSLDLQRRAGLKRRFPDGLSPHLGAQWWTLSWRSCETAMALAQRPEIHRFFRRTWVPDELFFQTVVASRVPAEQRRSCLLTHTLFSDRGVPVVFHDDHTAYLQNQPAFFARKLSPRADGLRDALDRFADGAPPAPTDDDIGRRTDDYATFLRRHEHGLPGHFSWGRPPASASGALARLDRPWFVITGDDEKRLASVREALVADPRLHCHHALLAPDHIGFADGEQELCGYRRDDMRLRDQAPLDFLADVLGHHPEGVTGFTLCLGGRTGTSAEALLRRLYAAPGCHVLQLAGPNKDRDRQWRMAATGDGTRNVPHHDRWITLEGEPTETAFDAALQRAIDTVLARFTERPGD